MPNVYWMVAGIVLFCVEMFLVDAQFYLVFIGAAAVVVGLLGWFGLELPAAAQWLLFAALSLVAMMGFRKQLYTKLRTPQDSVPESLSVGDTVRLPAALSPGETCRVEYRGSTWTARNVGSALLSGEVAIVHIEGLTLHVR